MLLLDALCLIFLGKSSLFKNILKTHETVWQHLSFCFFFCNIDEKTSSVDRQKALMLEEFIKTNLIYKNVRAHAGKQTDQGGKCFPIKTSKACFISMKKPEAGGCEPNSIYCWIISHHAEICPHEATSLIPWTKQQDQLCRHNKPYSWLHSVGRIHSAWLANNSAFW